MVRKRVKTGLAFLLAFSMTVPLFSACSTSTATGSSEVPSSSGSASEEEKLDPYEFSLYVNYDWVDVSPQWGKDKVSAALKEKFNITTVLQKPEGDPNTKFNIMLASDDLPDAMELERDASYQKLIQLGKIIPLDDYISKYPGYKGAVSADTVNLMKTDGKSYCVLNWATTKDHPTGNDGWAYNKKIYEQIGSPKLETTDDLYNALALVKSKNLTVNGQPVIPLQFTPTDQNGLIRMYNTFGGMEYGKGVTPIDGKLKLYWTDPKFTEAMVFMNKLWNAGFINQDYFVEKTEQVTEKLSTGRVFLYGGADVSDTNMKDARARLKEVDKDNDYVVIEPIAGPGLKQADIKNGTYSTPGWNALVITNKAEKPERIFQLWDYCCTDEGARLTVYGPKGEMYDEVDDKGYPVLKKTEGQLSDAEKKELGIWSWTYPGVSLYTDLSKVAADNRKPVEQRDWSIQAQVNIIWKHRANADAFVGMNPDPQSAEGIAWTSFKDLQLKMGPKFVTAKDENGVKTALQNAIDQAYKLGFDKVEAYTQTVYEKNLKALGE